MLSRRFRSATAVLVVAVLSLGLVACGGDTEDASDEPIDRGSETGGGDEDHGDDDAEHSGDAAATVALKAATFEPSEVMIKVGETVEWKWDGGVKHNVNGDGFKSELQDKGSFKHTFDAAGTFAFKCDVHPTTMTGNVTVE